MYYGIYKIADTVIGISSLYEAVQDLCADYKSEDRPEIEIRIMQEDILFEKAQSENEDRAENVPIRSFPDDYLETLAVYRRLATMLLNRNVLLFHGSAVAVDGKAYLFTARSGTGKSTHTRIWREMLGDRAVMINDDKPLLKIGEDGVTVYGTPWDGKHHLSRNMQAPLRAVCVLERGRENRICDLTAHEALPVVLQQSYRPREREACVQMLSLADRFIKSTRFCRLKCNMDPEAARLSYGFMRNL